MLDKCHRQIETVIRSCIQDEIDCTTTEHTLKECFSKNEANMTKVSQCVTHVDDSHVDDFIASDEIQHLLSCATEHVEECELLIPSGKIKTELEERRRRRIWEFWVNTQHIPYAHTHTRFIQLFFFGTSCLSLFLFLRWWHYIPKKYIWTRCG